MTKVPITPEVLRWAIEESGFRPDEVAASADVAPEVLDLWLAGKDQPSLTQTRALAAKLSRQVACFLLAGAPALPKPAVEFRRPPGSARREPNPVERRALREAVRIQRVVAWIRSESGAASVDLPLLATTANAEEAAEEARHLLDIAPEARLGWQSSSEAFSGWREALERLGILVFARSLGATSCRGFSIWEERAPLIVANTWWNLSARSYTILHEFGHLLTRTSSVCVEPADVVPLGAGDAVERWCEEFAAAVLLPMKDVERYLRDHSDWRPGGRVTSLDPISKLARGLNVSLRAAAIRLIKADIAAPSVYAAIPGTTDEKRRGGGAAGGRPRYQTRRDAFGNGTVRVFLEAVDSGVLGPTDAMEYLNVGYSELGALAATADTRSSSE